MLYVNNDLIPGEFSTPSSGAGAPDYVEFIVSGA